MAPTNEDYLAYTMVDTALRAAIHVLSGTNQVGANASTAQVNGREPDRDSRTSAEPPPSENGEKEPAVRPIHLLCSDCSSGGTAQRFPEPYPDQDKESSDTFTESPDIPLGSPAQPVKLLRRVSTKELMARSEVIEQVFVLQPRLLINYHFRYIPARNWKLSIEPLFIAKTISRLAVEHCGQKFGSN